MKAPLNIGLIGCGRAAELIYLPALAHLTAQAHLVAVADPVEERRELIASNLPGCRPFASAEALVEKANVAAVIVTTPPATHLGMTTLALGAGLPVLVEKPLAPSMEGVEELRSLAATSNGAVMVGFNRRYWEPVRQLQQILHNHTTVNNVSAQLVLISNAQAWSPVTGVADPLDDLGSHQFDLLRFIFQREIVGVSAGQTNTSRLQMQVRLAGNIVAECIAAQSNLSQETINIQCNGQHYQIQLGSEVVKPATGPIRTALDLLAAFNRRVLRQPSSFRRSYERQLIDFFNYVRTGSPPQPGIEDGIAVIRAVEAVRESVAQNNKEVLI